VRAVTRNINFPVVDIFHSRSKEPLPLRTAVASPRYTTTFNINTFSKSKAYNLYMAEEHVPYTWYTGKTDSEGSRSQEYLTFAPEKINTIDPIPSPVSIKQGLRTTEYGLQIIDYGLRTTDCELRTTVYGLGIKHGLRYKTWTKHYRLGIKYELGIKHGLGYEQAHWV